MSTGWDFFVTGLNVAIEENGTVKMVTRWKIASHLAGIVLVGAGALKAWGAFSSTVWDGVSFLPAVLGTAEILLGGYVLLRPCRAHWATVGTFFVFACASGGRTGRGRSDFRCVILDWAARSAPSSDGSRRGSVLANDTASF